MSLPTMTIAMKAVDNGHRTNVITCSNALSVHCLGVRSASTQTAAEQLWVDLTHSHQRATTGGNNSGSYRKSCRRTEGFRVRIHGAMIEPLPSGKDYPVGVLTERREIVERQTERHNDTDTTAELFVRADRLWHLVQCHGSNSLENRQWCYVNLNVKLK